MLNQSAQGCDPGMKQSGQECDLGESQVRGVIWV